jgi:hypothetical protein
VPAYDEIGNALSRSFSLDELRIVTTLSLQVLQGSPKHPAIFLTLAAVCRWVADAWDDTALQSPVADRVESQLRPHLRALLDLSEGDPAQVCAALNALASAFHEAVERGLDSDLA